MEEAAKLKQLIKADPDLLKILKIIAALELREGCLCAGAIRNTVWNHLSGLPRAIVSDLDVIFFDPTISEGATYQREKALQTSYPEYQWQLKNQVTMHNHHPQAIAYQSVADALSHFPEKCTAIGVRLVAEQLELVAPYGLTDLFAMKVAPTPSFKQNQKTLAVYRQRLANKKWSQQWPKLQIENQ